VHAPEQEGQLEQVEEVGHLDHLLRRHEGEHASDQQGVHHEDGALADPLLQPGLLVTLCLRVERQQGHHGWVAEGQCGVSPFGQHLVSEEHKLDHISYCDSKHYIKKQIVVYVCHI